MAFCSSRRAKQRPLRFDRGTWPFRFHTSDRRSCLGNNFSACCPTGQVKWFNFWTVFSCFIVSVSHETSTLGTCTITLHKEWFIKVLNSCIFLLKHHFSQSKSKRQQKNTRGRAVVVLAANLDINRYHGKSKTCSNISINIPISV